MTDLDAREKLAARLRAHLERPEYPLSYPQQRPWFLDQLQKNSTVYNLPMAYRIRGPLDVAALREALTEVTRRHEVLRAVYRTVGGAPKQIVQPAREVELVEVDVAAEAEPERAAAALAVAEARTPFDLTAGPMLRVKLVRLADEDRLLLLTLHHISCDAWSVGIIAREASALYAARTQGTAAQLPPLKLQYVDFTDWQAKALHGSARHELMRYWRDKLAGIPASINLPTDRPRPPVQDYDGGHVFVEIPADVVTEVDALARRSEATPFAVLMAAFAALLARTTGDDDVVIGTPVANRNQLDLEPLVGFFTNTLVFRPDLSGAPSFPELVRRVGAETRQNLAHQDLPFEIVVEELRPDRNPAHSPVFQVMFIYWDADDSALWSLPGCTVTAEPGDSATAKFDLTLSLTRSGDVIRARFEFATSLYDEATIARMARQYVTLLRSGLADAATPARALPMLPEEQRRQLVEQWGRGAPLPSATRFTPELIAAQVRRTPTATAVLDVERELTYQQLATRAAALAGALAAQGVGRGSTVGVYLDRSVDTVVALVGILFAGAAYLPLDPAYPAERLAFMCSDAGARVVVSRRGVARPAQELGATMLWIDEVATAATAATAAALPTAPTIALPELDPEDLAYVIYTSGSTGKPKGVMLTHRNVATFFAAMDAMFGDEAPGTWLAVTSISFDISVLELLWTLTRGFRIAVRSDEPRAGEAQRTPATTQPAVPPPAAGPTVRTPDFSLFYFGNASAAAPAATPHQPYRLVLEGAAFADEHDFAAVWTPERHFHPFGGLFPNPSVLAAAIAARTKRVAIRAGSVVAPLHDPLRIAEEWAVVDQLSGGRVGISLASGWQPDDFALAPGKYEDRKREMMKALSQIRRLWRGEKVQRKNGAGAEIDVRVYPRPVQEELPVWLTSARHPETFQMAGEAGTGLLTHLIGHTIEQLAEKIAAYRKAWQEHGWPGRGRVTLMIHTFVHPDLEHVRATVRGPLREYIRSSFDLMAGLGAARNVDVRSLPPAEVEALLDHAFERFFASSGLLGTPEMAAATVERLIAIGVDEVGCLIDFGVADDEALAALPHLAATRALLRRRGEPAKGIAAPAVEASHETVAEQLARLEVSHLQCTPGFARMLVGDAAARARLPKLARLLVGGEALPEDLAEDLATIVGGSVHNMYGPTEATVWATTSRVATGAAVTIGGPLPGYQAYVVDAALQPAPIGVPGELLLGGEAIARGYHLRDELTRDRFVPDELGPVPGRRLYRTGDLVRWRASGELEFLGRLDHQVKLRGRRIELGEIEAALRALPPIGAAVVDVRGSGDARGLVAYCVAAAGAQLPPADVLRRELSRTLPEHMLPAAFLSLPELPLTPNGKVNRRALPEPEQARPELSTNFEAPSTPLEESIAAVWRAVLKIAKVGVRDNFFELGGNSILTVAVRSRLLQEVDAGLSLVDMFRYPTIAGLASALTARRQEATPVEAAASAGAQAGLARRAAMARKQPPRVEGK